MVLCIASPTTIFAQETSTTLSESLLNLIVVSASRFNESFREVTSNITVISGEEIDSSSTNTLDDLFIQKGFKISKNPGGSLSTIQIRGFSTDAHGNDLGSHVLIVINGRRIATGNSSMISLANVDHIEIIRGPAAVQFGASAMGGVVNIITKKGVGQPFHALLSAEGGSYDTFKALARLSGSYENFDIATAFNFITQGNMKTGAGVEFANSDFKTYAFSLETGYTFEELHRIGLSLNYFDSPDTGSPGYYPQNDSDIAARVDKNNFAMALDYTGSTADNRFSWTAMFSHGVDNREYIDTRGLEETSTYKVISNLANAQLTFNQDIFTITGGIDYLHYDSTSNEAALSAHGSKYSNFAPFLIAKIRLLEEKLILSLGGRYDFFTIDLEDTGKHTDKNHFSPSIGIAYLPIENLKIRAHYTKGFALPTDSQLGANFIYSYYGTNYYYIGNENLAPEYSDSYEFGIDVFNNYADFEITYFWNKTRNFISTSRYLIDGPNWYYTYINNDIAYRSGVEIAAAIDIGGLLDQNFVLKPSLSLTHFFTFKTRTTPTSLFQPITGVPENAIAFNLFFKHPESDFMANLSISRFTNQLTATTGAHLSYTTVDLVLQKRLLDFNQFGKLSARVSVNNFTNEDFRTNNSAGYMMPGRRIYGGLIYEY